MMFLKLAVLNNSGNVGKSTICETLLKPRLKDAEIVKIETINSDGTDDVKFSADEFNEVLQQIYASDCSIIDVGSSNIESFMLKMQEFKGSHEDIDFFIIPVTPSHKQQIDSASTIEMLLMMGVEPERIKFIFNRTNKKIQVEKQYAEFLEKIKSTGIDQTKFPTLHETVAFTLLSQNGKSFNEVSTDDRDFKTLLRKATSTDERMAISEERSVKRLIDGVNEEFDIAFENLGVANG